MRFWEEEQERKDLGTCCLILPCSFWEVQPTYLLLQRHENGQITLLFCKVGCASLLVAERSSLVQTTRDCTAEKDFLTADFTCFSNRVEAEPSHGRH